MMKGLAISMGLGIAAGAVAVMMLPQNCTVRRAVNKAAHKVENAAEKVAEIAKRDHGMSSVDVFVKGIGLGRDSAIRAFSTLGIQINSITDKTPIKHGGCRPKGERKP